MAVDVRGGMMVALRGHELALDLSLGPLVARGVVEPQVVEVDELAVEAASLGLVALLGALGRQEAPPEDDDGLDLPPIRKGRAAG